MERRRVQKVFSEMPSMTKQSFRDDCDISLIMRRFTQTGQLPDVRQRELVFGNSEGDFQAAMFAIAEARSKFETLNPEVKEKYGSVEGLYESLESVSASELHADGVLEVFDIHLPDEALQAGTEPHNESQQELPLADSEPKANGGEATSEASQNA